MDGYFNDVDWDVIFKVYIFVLKEDLELYRLMLFIFVRLKIGFEFCDLIVYEFLGFGNF